MRKFILLVLFLLPFIVKSQHYIGRLKKPAIDSLISKGFEKRIDSPLKQMKENTVEKGNWFHRNSSEIANGLTVVYLIISALLAIFTIRLFNLTNKSTLAALDAAQAAQDSLEETRKYNSEMLKSLNEQKKANEPELEILEIKASTLVIGQTYRIIITFTNTGNFPLKISRLFLIKVSMSKSVDEHDLKSNIGINSPHIMPVEKGTLRPASFGDFVISAIDEADEVKIIDSINTEKRHVYVTLIIDFVNVVNKASKRKLFVCKLKPDGAFEMLTNTELPYE